jgi:hypothetical protein
MAASMVAPGGGKRLENPNQNLLRYDGNVRV